MVIIMARVLITLLSRPGSHSLAGRAAMSFLCFSRLSDLKHGLVWLAVKGSNKCGSLKNYPYLFQLHLSHTILCLVVGI